MGGFRLSGKTRFDDSGSEIFAIESGDKTDADAFRTDGLTLILIAARAESFSIHGFRVLSPKKMATLPRTTIGAIVARAIVPPVRYGR